MDVLWAWVSSVSVSEVSRGFTGKQVLKVCFICRSQKSPIKFFWVSVLPGLGIGVVGWLVMPVKAGESVVHRWLNFWPKVLFGQLIILRTSQSSFCSSCLGCLSCLVLCGLDAPPLEPNRFCQGPGAALGSAWFCFLPGTWA